jgi:hypothetical protein
MWLNPTTRMITVDMVTQDFIKENTINPEGNKSKKTKQGEWCRHD